MIAQNFIDRGLQFGQAGLEYRILDGVGRIVHQIAGDEDIGRIQRVGCIHGRFHKRIGMGKTRRFVYKTYLSVAHLDKSERLKRMAGGGQNQDYA